MVCGLAGAIPGAKRDQAEALGLHERPERREDRDLASLALAAVFQPPARLTPSPVCLRAWPSRPSSPDVPRVSLSDDRALRLQGPPPDRRIAEMHTEDAMDDISLLLIEKKAGYGLAPRKWRTALEAIRALPEVSP